MQKPFQKLTELLGVSSSKKKIEEEPPPFKAKDWEEVSQIVKPLEDKNCFYLFSPKKPFSPRENFWPPLKITIDFSLTSEYIQGKKPFVNPEIFRKLKSGELAVQAVLNLRGLFLDEAKFVFENFIKEALYKGLTCVLIVHGRGLGSKGEPVLKKKVKEWLERGPFRKYILAYASARPCDGGVGATYVLLTPKPIKK